jgi:voltage-gated potassium channel
MTTADSTAGRHGNAYNIFILILTVASLAIMVLLVLPINSATKDLLAFYDNAIAFIFLIDFFLNLTGSPSKKRYFINERGWLDLLGSIPTLGILQYAGLLRLARLSRLFRIAHLLRGQNKKRLVDDVVRHRAQYAVFITILLAFLVLVTASVIVLNAESRSDTANIKTGWDAFWWGFVTITTVGYGDRFPTTVMGRIAAMFVMTMGIGIIGALASIMASILVGSSPSEESATETSTEPSGLERELAGVKQELLALRRVVERLEGRAGHTEPPAVGDDRGTSMVDPALPGGGHTSA